MKFSEIRRKTREVVIGNKKIGGQNHILIQSMNNTDTRNVAATVAQIKELEAVGCEMTRVAVLDEEAARAIGSIVKEINIPLVADIHFDYKLALLAMDGNIHKLRINPGNIGERWKVKEVVEKAKGLGIPIRIGVNSGSVEKDIEEKYKGVTAEGLVESAMRHVEILEDLNFTDTVISIKASSAPLTIDAYTLLSQKVDYPLHVGVTESGTIYGGSIKSTLGIGTLLMRGIGDTIRVSLTGNPVDEIACAKEILKAGEVRQFGVNFISCPTCGRTEIDLIRLANEVEKRCAHITENITVAVMGCIVNGPGEGKHADIGVAGGRGKGVIFKDGVILRSLPESELLEGLMAEIDALVKERSR